MLVLSRRIGERIFIGPDIIIEFLGFHGNQLRIGITAPSDVKILRAEVARQIEGFNQITRSQPTKEGVQVANHKTEGIEDSTGIGEQRTIDPKSDSTSP